MASNPEAADLLLQGVDATEVGRRMQAVAVDAPGGPWSVAVGATLPGKERPDGWSGHLILGAPDTGLVADLSADQASRPHKALHLQPYWERISNPAWFTRLDAPHMVHREDGSLLVLDRGAVQDPVGYRRSVNWRRKVAGEPFPVFKQITGQIIRAMRQDLHA